MNGYLKKGLIFGAIGVGIDALIWALMFGYCSSMTYGCGMEMLVIAWAIHPLSTIAIINTQLIIPLGLLQFFIIGCSIGIMIQHHSKK